MFDTEHGVAQSEVIGIILILGITFTGISIILVTGNPSLEDTKELARTSTAENGMALLDERISSAALSRSDKKRLTLNLQSGEMSVSPEAGSMKIYSSPPALLWSESPDANDAVHVLNFTVEGGSDLVGNDTNPKRLRGITVTYPSGAGFDVTGSDVVTSGIDTDMDGRTEGSPGVPGSGESYPTQNRLRIDFNENSAGRLNETNLITVRYNGIEQPSGGGEYDVRIAVENDDGNTVKKSATVTLGDGVSEPVRQIDTQVSMGSIEYETEDSVVAYQNGGVWTKLKGEDRISRTVSKPEVYYGGNTLTASIINITNAADISLGGSPSLTATNTENVRVFPKRGTQKTNPLTDRNVYIDVSTSYYNAWSSYFETETVGDVVDIEGTGETRTVGVELSPLPDTVYNHAVLTRNGNLTLTNTTVDSYDAAVSDYSTRFRFGNADITAAGNITLENETGTSALLSRVYGDVLAGDRVLMENRTVVNGSVKARGHPGAPGGENITIEGTGCRVQDRLKAPGTIDSNCDSSQEDERMPSESLPDIELVDDEIDERIEEYSDNPNYLPDGDGKSVVNVSSGNYYVDEDHDTSASGTGQLYWNGKTVRFETDGGPINIAVKNGSDSVLRPSNTVLEIDGTNPVRIYSGNYSTSITSQPKIEFENITMKTPGNRTDLFTVFVHSTKGGFFTQYTNVTVRGGSEFYGTLYAPDSDHVQVTDSEVHGAIVAGEADIVNSGIHYDQQLRDPAAEGVSAVNYLHVTDNRVRVR